LQAWAALAQAVLIGLAFISSGAWAMGGQNMVLGRMVLPRADAPSVAVTRHPRAHYLLHCAGCHGPDGRGVPQSYVPDLRRLGQFLRIPGGREFLVSVPGVMGSGLSDAQVAEVTNWVLDTLAGPSVPEDHRPYSASEVQRARAQPLADVAARRQQLVNSARAAGVAID
jgi:mono/diheme cytochrome c family protein